MKYIIDLPDKLYAMNGELRIPIRFGESPVKEWRRTGLNVKPHTEPDRSAIEDEVWEFVCKFVWAIDDKEILGTDILHAVRDMSYQEAKAKYDAWKKQWDEIRVGDEVQYSLAGYEYTFIVFRKENDVLYGMRTDKEYMDDICEAWDYCNKSDSTLEKTGRHFPEVAELLKKMREE